MPNTASANEWLAETRRTYSLTPAMEAALLEALDTYGPDGPLGAPRGTVSALIRRGLAVAKYGTTERPASRRTGVLGRTTTVYNAYLGAHMSGPATLIAFRLDAVRRAEAPRRRYEDAGCTDTEYPGFALAADGEVFVHRVASGWVLRRHPDGDRYTLTDPQGATAQSGTATVPEALRYARVPIVREMAVRGLGWGTLNGAPGTPA